MGRAEFTLLIMKFANNKLIEDPLEFLEKLISKMFEYELAKVQYVDKKSPFNSMLSRFDKTDDLLCGNDVCNLQEQLDAKIEVELARVESIRADS